MAVYLKKNNSEVAHAIMNGKKIQGNERVFKIGDTCRVSNEATGYCYRILTTYEGTFMYLSNDPKILKQHGFIIIDES